MTKNFNRNIKNSFKLSLIFLILIISILTLSALIPFNTSKDSNININENSKRSIEIPRISDQMINIITPEGKTYYNPMSGYFPATYGFERDKVGETGTDISFIDNDNTAGTCEVSIIGSLDDHNNLMKLYDPSDGSGLACVFSNNFSSSQTEGVIEYWIRKDSNNAGGDGYTGGRIRLLDNSNIIGLSVVFGYYTWMRIYSENSTGYDVTIMNNIVYDQWYHIKIHFNCTTDTFNCYVNGVYKGNYEFRNPVSQLCKARFETDGAYEGIIYIDAIGYSWDSYYNIGDNLNEGLLLGFNNFTNLDWMGYSLDGQTNRTILGNSTLKMPDGGRHSIQVFGNDTSGVKYCSNIRYFIINVFNLITPENKTYTGPMTGYYPATYGFECDKVGDIPIGWDIIEGRELVSVIESKDNHRMVLKLDNISTSTWVYMFNYFPDKSSGTIELWAMLNASAPSELLITLQDGIAANSIEFYFAKTGYFAYYGGSTTYSICPYIANKLYHIKIEWDCSDD